MQAVEQWPEPEQKRNYREKTFFLEKHHCRGAAACAFANDARKLCISFDE
jgi:hypothetical protein